MARNNQALTEALDKKISRLRENSNEEARIQNALNRKADKTMAKLVFELVRPTIVSEGKKFIPPNFNAIKSYLIADIKASIAMMVKESGMSKEECIGYLLDPAQYDDEIGNYADTTFAEAYSDLYDGHSELNLLMYIEDDLIKYLDKNIKATHKQLEAAVR